MEGPISDSAAIEFSRGFYDAIGAGRDIEFAYEEGCRSVDLAAPNTRWNSKFLRQGEVYEAEYAESDVESQSSVSRDLKDLRALVGLAVDLSGSMSQSIKNKESECERVETSLDLFAYGFGLRDLDVCDLLSLMKVGKHVITKEEIEELKDRYAREMRSRYSGYEGLGGIARQFGLGDLVRQAEGAVRASAEAEIRRKIMLEVKRRIENQLDAVGDTTLPVEEVAKLWDSSGETLGNAEELIFGMTPMKQALNLVVERFRQELTNRPKGTQAVLFILSDGEPTDGDPRLAAESLRAMGITVISCFVTDQDIADPRTLYSNPEPDWNNGARLMFDIASIVDDESDFARFLLKKGWTIGQDAKLFVQINYSEVLEEFIRVVISPLEERQEYVPLPRGV